MLIFKFGFEGIIKILIIINEIHFVYVKKIYSGYEKLIY